MPTIRGTVKMDFKNSGNSWNLKITIPGNTESELWLPASFSEVSINSEKTDPIRKETYAGKKRNVFLLTSGKYMIVAE
jgi:hypothetical protein